MPRKLKLKTLPQKPEPEPQPPALDWVKVREYLEVKYDINLRDYKGNYQEGDNRVYRDFLVWLVERKGLVNGSYFNLAQEDYDETEHWWVREIINLIFKEFAPRMGLLRLLVDW